MPTRWRILSLLLIATTFAALASSAPPVTATVRPAVPSGQDCANLIQNGGFEIDYGWEFDPSLVLPQYANTVQRAGSRSLRLGIPNTVPNIAGLSSARQTVAIPATATSAVLSFWYYPVVEASPGADYFEMAVLSTDGSAVLAGPWRMPIGLETWQSGLYDFSAWRGQTFQLSFRVYNDGLGGRTAAFLDDVSFASCLFPAVTSTPTPWPTLTPTWTPWPTPWPTAPPPPWTPPPSGGCIDLLQNGGFDASLAGWTSGNNPLRPSVVASPALTPPYAAELGPTFQNVNSYSSIRQTVTVPGGYARTFIGFWEYTWAESLVDVDVQQFVLIGPDNTVWATPWKVLESSEVWQQHLYELIGAPSPTFDVYFAAVNDGSGGRTVLYVDEVHVWGCPAEAMPAMDVMSAAPAMGAVPLSEPPLAMQTIPLTPNPPLFVEPAFAPVMVVTPEMTVTPVVVPFAGVVFPESGVIGQGTPVPLGTPLDVTGLPTAEWTEVTLSGQPTASLTPVSVAQALPLGTPTPPEARSVEAPEIDPAAVLTQAVAIVSTVAPSPTRLPFGLFSSISERTAQWPISWPWVLVIIVLVVAALIWLIRRSSRGNYYNP